MTKVAILLSTYNGEKYLGEQIDSIKKQTFSDWKLFIRDDGSNDGTVALIKKYAAEDARIRFINEEQVENVGGVTRSFFSLLENAQADYYMFCDQDDFWLPQKIAATLEKMEEMHARTPQKPHLVHTNYKAVDRKLNLLGELNYDEQKHDLATIVFFNNVTGCTTMIDDNLKKLACQADLNKVMIHDQWVALIASALGEMYYFTEPLMLYRQHENNQIGGGVDFFIALKKGIFSKNKSAESKQALKKAVKIKLYDKSWKRDSLAVTQVNHLRTLFYSQMDPANKKVIDIIADGLNGRMAARWRLIRKALPKKEKFLRRSLADLLLLLG